MQIIILNHQFKTTSQRNKMVNSESFKLIDPFTQAKHWYADRIQHSQFDWSVLDSKFASKV